MKGRGGKYSVGGIRKRKSTGAQILMVYVRNDLDTWCSCLRFINEKHFKVNLKPN